MCVYVFECVCLSFYISIKTKLHSYIVGKVKGVCVYVNTSSHIPIHCVPKDAHLSFF